jgi:hypothetical protein
MNTNTKNNHLPKKALELLPWFAIGVTSAEEQAYFQQALLKYPELQKLLDQELEIKRLVSEDKSLLDLSVLEPMDERLKSVLNQIDSIAVNQTDNHQVNIGFAGIFKRALKSWIPADLGIWQYSGFASAAILVAVLMAFVAPLFNQGKITEQSKFTTASAVNPEVNEVASTTVLLVGFNGSPEDLRGFPAFKDKLEKIEAVPSKKGIYRVSLNKKLDKVKTKELIETLMAQKELVWFVGEDF